MILRKMVAGLKKHDWSAVVLETLIVVIGIFIGLQVDDWNQARQDRSDIAIYLQRIHEDLEKDIKFFTFLASEAREKRNALEALGRVIREEEPPNVNASAFIELLAQSLSIGFEFPEVQTVTFFDLQSNGKLGLVEDAGLRLQLSFYYQESLHRSDRIESRITGYAAALYEMVDLRAGLVLRISNSSDKIAKADNVGFDQRAAVAKFLTAARTGRFSDLLTAEQNYTEFMLAQVYIQIEETRSLQASVAKVFGFTNQ